jgi:hypothetical protein
MLEVALFVALGIFGFAVVGALVGLGPQTVSVPIVPNLPGVPAQEQAPVFGLFEASSLRLGATPTLSPVFTASVKHWEEDLIRWAGEQGIDPNLAATVMQIESCGNPVARSSAGAMGLFQVMPFHFEMTEDPYDPDRTRCAVLYAGGLRRADTQDWHWRGITAGTVPPNYNQWHSETQAYYRWGSGIYREASAGWGSSPTLQAWLNAGGESLCVRAEDHLGIAEPGLNRESR